MQSMPGRRICCALLSGSRPTWGDSACVLLPNGHMKREFEKCCYRGNPIFRAPVCSLAYLCKKEGQGKKKSVWMKVCSASKGKPSWAHKGKGWENLNVQDELWDQGKGQRSGQSAFWHPGCWVYGDDIASSLLVFLLLITVQQTGVKRFTTDM